MLTLTVRPVSGACNAACSYCYLKAVRQPRLEPMSRDVMRSMIARYQVPERPRCRYVWHGGEPTLAGMLFFEEALRLQQALASPGQTITNFIQTNAWLIDAAWANFLARNRFRVGISLDGHEAEHDAQRGNGSFKRTSAGVRHLRRAGIHPTCICVVTSRNVEHPDELLNFLHADGFRRISFNPIFGEHVGSDVVPARFGRFLCAVFDRWLALDDPALEVRFLKETVLGLLGGCVDLCAMQGGLQGHVVVESNGDVLPCYSSDTREPIGNVATMDFAEAEARLAALVAPIRAFVGEDCRSCSWLRLCGGDCVRFVGRSNGRFSRTPLCDARQEIFGHVKRRLVERGYLAG